MAAGAAVQTSLVVVLLLPLLPLLLNAAEEPASSPSPAPAAAAAPAPAKPGKPKRENIAKILSADPELSRFRRLLIRTQLSTKVNELEHATVLVVDNKALLEGGIGKDVDAKTLKRILSMHVLLDYLDESALADAKNEQSVHTLYSTTGRAQAATGGLTLVRNSSGNGKQQLSSGVAVRFKCSGNGTAVDLVKSIYDVPGNLSVLQVSGVLIPPNIDPEHPYPTSSLADAYSVTDSDSTDDDQTWPFSSKLLLPKSAPASAPAPAQSASAPGLASSSFLWTVILLVAGAAFSAVSSFPF